VRMPGRFNSTSRVQHLAYERDDRARGHQRPLLDWMFRTKGARCLDPRDQIFGLLGLVSPDERKALGEDLPDYSISVDDLLLRLLRHTRSYYGKRVLSYYRALLLYPLGVSLQHIGLISNLIERRSRPEDLDDSVFALGSLRLYDLWLEFQRLREVQPVWAAASRAPCPKTRSEYLMPIV
jgi:hypothetical protein